MNKIGVNLSIDVTAIDKERMVSHANGKVYLNMTVFIDPNNPGQYGDHGMITQDVSKEEKAQNIKGPILGNAKIFWNEPVQQQAPTQGYQNLGGGQPYMQPVPPQQPVYTPERQPQLPSCPQQKAPAPGFNPTGYAPQQGQQMPPEMPDDTIPF